MGGGMILKKAKRIMSRNPKETKASEGDHAVCHPQKSVPSPLVPL